MKKEIVKFVMSNIFVNQNESFISMDIVGERCRSNSIQMGCEIISYSRHSSSLGISTPQHREPKHSSPWQLEIIECSVR